MRELLVGKLAEAGSAKDWGHITSQVRSHGLQLHSLWRIPTAAVSYNTCPAQIGMFAFSGLSKDQVDAANIDNPQAWWP